MKKIIYLLTAVALLVLSSCADKLNTEPTDKVSGSTIFATAESAEVAINGIYRGMFVSGWSVDWSPENFGHLSVVLAADLMGEDHLMFSSGQGWFYDDYKLDSHTYFTGKDGRPYAFWKFYYTMVSNANFIIGSEATMGGDPELKKSVLAQAYAVRAFSYFYLVQLYQQTYKGNEDAPGVPLYTKPTVMGSVGAPRGTVQGVYDQINKDIDRSLELFADMKSVNQKHSSHIDYYVAQGLKARICLVQHQYADAATAATEAMGKASLDILNVADFIGVNSVRKANVMWGFEIIPNQSTVFSSWFSHMDADARGKYAEMSPKCVSSGLYDLIPDTDERKSAWFRSGDVEIGPGSMVPYCQQKFLMVDTATVTGDYIMMRKEEMLLIKAEAECHQGQYAEARNTITELGSKRNPEYAAVLATLTDSKEYDTKDANAAVKTLMEEILLQRRLELWGESGRVFDLQRLGIGYKRTYKGSNHTERVVAKNTNAGSPFFIFPLPQSEIDGNENITAEDQNKYL